MPTKFGKSAILWADPENKHKLLVAIFAASEPKVNSPIPIRLRLP